MIVRSDTPTITTLVSEIFGQGTLMVTPGRCGYGYRQTVSIIPSGEIVADSSVTLTCSSDANPPVQNYTWFKEGGTSPVGSGQNYITNSSGYYYCVAQNEHGNLGDCSETLPSPAQTLTVRYPPKNVSISPSGQIVEESSVTLTCSSDANPPVQNYTWFKEGGTSPEGSGQNYIIISSGWYYCVAQNEHGVLKSASTDITLKGDTQTAGHFYILPVAVGVGICGIVLPLSVVLFMKRQSLRRYKKQRRNPDESVYENVGLKPCPTCDTSTFSSPVYENTAALRKHQRRVPLEDLGRALSVVQGWTLQSLTDPRWTIKSNEVVPPKAPSRVHHSEASKVPRVTFREALALSEEETFSTSVRSLQTRVPVPKPHRGKKKATPVPTPETGKVVGVPPEMDPPKNVSISPSGEIVEGSSVTLTCSSDANPPVQNYTWFIEGGTSAVGSGQAYSIIIITAEHTGL
ncbi:uncharacterized protein LOC113589841 [Electrophorus electricus]|uniref:uncharacterized protein LOC113589841 n=1 Tax=Electrophorus electricus TaxID=8005 RepID=UPI0015D00346|nr:uncharacterized protein LOC113589841 [Electrophorus electricus]